jgi:hypothetical protein
VTNKYELSTIKDIFEKVPADRIETCMAEFAVLLRQSAFLRDNLAAFAGVAGVDVSGKDLVKIPDSFEWVDDGLGDLTLKVGTSDGTHICDFSVKAVEQ